jgi:hypothetical protein
MKSANPLCVQPKEKNNPAKSKEHKGLRTSPCKRPKKIWFACRIPVTLFGSINELSFCIEEIVLRALELIHGQALSGRAGAGYF